MMIIFKNLYRSIHVAWMQSAPSTLKNNFDGNVRHNLGAACMGRY